MQTSLRAIGVLEAEGEAEGKLAVAPLASTLHQRDGSEFTDRPYWHHLLEGGNFPVSMWEDRRVYTHAIVRDPVERVRGSGAPTPATVAAE